MSKLIQVARFIVSFCFHGEPRPRMRLFQSMNRLWVDQVTTLDPQSVSLYGDAEVFTYVNVLFADNYWQSTPDLFGPNGNLFFGSYNRYLDNLSGRYDCPHSGTHLWCHGAIDLTVPTSDTQSTITAAEHQNRWSPYEAGGTNERFYYSLVGGGNRLSAIEPAGAGMGRIVNGYNQAWDLGADASGNR